MSTLKFESENSKLNKINQLKFLRSTTTTSQQQRLIDFVLLSIKKINEIDYQNIINNLA